MWKTNQIWVIPVSLNSKISDSLIRDQEINKRSGDQSLPILKTDWCLTLMIKSYHQEYMSWVETISKKKKKKRAIPQEMMISIPICMHFFYVGEQPCLRVPSPNVITRWAWARKWFKLFFRLKSQKYQILWIFLYT